MKKIFLLFALFIVNLSPLHSCESCKNREFKSLEEQFEVDGDKIYLDADKISIDQHGIILYCNDYPVMLPCIYSDNKGIYILKPPLMKDCFNAHPTWCTFCGGCGVLWCPGRCKCFG